jgi:signal transduction histidine kinase
LAGLLAVAGVPTQPGRAPALLTVAAADLAVAALVWWLPWRRWGRYVPLVLSVPAFAILAFATWAFGGFAAGTGPFFVLMFAWAGLHFPAWAIAGMAPAALAAYVAPLVVTHQKPEVVSSAVVLLPIALGVGWIIATQVTHLRQAREQVRQVERWRAALTATVAHDVRSPLTAVRMALSILAKADDRLPPDRRQAVIVAAQQQTARIQRLAEGLLDVDRVDIRGELRLDRQDVTLRGAADEAVGYLDDTADVAVDIGPDLVVCADPHRLEQILINLTTNALNHGRPPVVIRAERANGAVCIEVRDHGDGVPESQQPHLFNQFSNVDATTGSVGLGLWIVRELARAHGGDVRYEPADPGARFVVTLPLER